MKFDPISYALHFGGRCRDCADNDGVCPTTGLPCDTKQASEAAQHCLSAWQYGIRHGYIDNPFVSAPPAPQVIPSESPWQWWAGEGEEWLTVGQEDTREAIISAATNARLGEFQHDGGGWNLSFYIVEARKDPLRLADWIHDCDIIDHAEDCLADSDRVASEFDEGPWFTCSAAQKKDLQERINRACDEWQAAHGLAFSCATFSHTRNEEHVIIKLPSGKGSEGSDNG